MLVSLMPLDSTNANEDTERTPVVMTEGLSQLTANEYLVLASTFHSIHAIASRISPVPGSSGVEVIEAESFKMSCLQTPTGSSSHTVLVPLVPSEPG